MGLQVLGAAFAHGERACHRRTSVATVPSVAGPTRASRIASRAEALSAEDPTQASQAVDTAPTTTR